MEPILRGFEVNDPTWFYLSFLLIISVYFRFSRLWSIRNVDLLLLLGIAPGLLLAVEYPVTGYSWLFVTTGLCLIRMLWDPLLDRRPKLEPNMNSAGLVFLCGAAFLFLMAKVLTESPATTTVESVRSAQQLIGQHPKGPTVSSETSQGSSATADEKTPATADEKTDAKSAGQSIPAGPSASLLAAPVVQITKAVTEGANQNVVPTAATDEADNAKIELIAARCIAILAHLAVILGLVFAGARVFGDRETGIAMATLYMLVPCTAIAVEQASHVLPAALIVWAIVAYRHPLISGSLIGLACGTLFFPIFLLPLWIGFYGRRGGLLFTAAFLLVTCGLLGTLYLNSADQSTLLRQVVGYIHWTDLQLQGSTAATGFWSSLDTVYRIPVFVAFLVMLCVLTFVPSNRNLTHLIAHSTAVILGTQFWYPREGGVYVLWYLPLLLLVIFRPVLKQHTAPQQLPLFGGRHQSVTQRTDSPSTAVAAYGYVGRL